jgi:hypothetical protein
VDGQAGLGERLVERGQVAVALGAGLLNIVTVSSFTAVEDFTGASLVVSSLGDLPDEPATVLANPHGLAIDGQVELSHVEHLLQTP